MKGELVLYIKGYCAHMHQKSDNKCEKFWVYNACFGKLLYFELFILYLFILL